ncbi:MAG TPA: hypothetical protein VIC58_08305 [Actinomycetota bacterium]
MRFLEHFRSRRRARKEVRRGRELEKAIAELELRRNQEASIWKSGKGGAHIDR